LFDAGKRPTVQMSAVGFAFTVNNAPFASLIGGTSWLVNLLIVPYPLPLTQLQSWVT
jgi:hypothetical protein